MRVFGQFVPSTSASEKRNIIGTESMTAALNRITAALRLLLHP